MKIAIIGAGSSYTPEIIEGLVQERAHLPVDEIALMDVDVERLEIMAGFCGRFLKHLGQDNIRITAVTERRAAIQDARFVLVQIRAGGNRQRILDEKIPLKFGIIGQETTGPGGMMKAFRTIPVMLEIAREVEAVSPEAWIINYTNPTGLVTEAVCNHTKAKIVGLCSGGLFPGWYASRALSIPLERIHYQYAGLNHLSFAYHFTVDGRPLTGEEFERVAEVAARGGIDPALIKALRMIPSPYLQYFYHASKKVDAAQREGMTRGEQVLELEREIYRAYADPKAHTKPEALGRRGGGGYSRVALSVMKAIAKDEEQVVIVNTRNRGAIRNFPEDAVVEIPCLINADGISRLQVGEIPAAVWGLISAVKNYEQLAVRAAVTGSQETALFALLAHPLVLDVEIARPMLAELLEANRAYLPQFYP